MLTKELAVRPGWVCSRLTAVAVALLAVASCAAAPDGGSRAVAVDGYRILVPNAPGGGYDATGRTAAKVMEDERILRGVEVFNLEGAGGTLGLARLVNESGNGKVAMLMGLGVVGAVVMMAATFQREYRTRTAWYRHVVYGNVPEQMRSVAVAPAPRGAGPTS